MWPLKGLNRRHQFSNSQPNWSWESDSLVWFLGLPWDECVIHQTDSLQLRSDDPSPLHVRNDVLVSLLTTLWLFNCARLKAVKGWSPFPQRHLLRFFWVVGKCKSTAKNSTRSLSLHQNLVATGVFLVHQLLTGKPTLCVHSDWIINQLMWSSLPARTWPGSTRPNQVCVCYGYCIT